MATSTFSNPSMPTRSNSAVSLKHSGSFGAKDYRVHACDEADNTPISLWHDIDLYVNKEQGLVNYVCEIPKGTRDKFEIDTKDTRNPIRQDLDKHGNLRQYKRGDVFFNYGAMPRTWEDPKHMIDVQLDKPVGGDNDPLDVCEIGLKKGKTGEVKTVKVLGVLCMIDDGEADWKVICIDATDRWAPEINDIVDVETHLPGVLDDIRNWWRVYKVAEGKPENKFGFGEKFMDKAFALRVVEETHEAWIRLAKSVILEKKESLLHVEMRDVESVHGSINDINSSPPSEPPSPDPTSDKNTEDNARGKKRDCISPTAGAA